MGQPYAWVSSHAYHLVHSRETVLSSFQPKQAVVAFCLHYSNGNHPPCSLCVCIFLYMRCLRSFRLVNSWFPVMQSSPSNLLAGPHCLHSDPGHLKCDARKPAWWVPAAHLHFYTSDQALLLTSALKVVPNRDFSAFSSSVLLLEVDLGVNILGVFRVKLRFLIAKRVQSGF